MRTAVGLMFASLVLLSSAAAAQQDVFTLPIERFRPTIDDNGTATVEGAAIPPHFGFQTGLVLNYALNPLVLRDGETNTIVAAIVNHRVGADATFTLGLFEYVSVGVDLPLTLVQLAGDVPSTLADAVGTAQGLSAIGVGDLKLVPKVRVLREDRHFVSLALIPTLTLPTAGGLRFTADGPVYDYGGSYLGEGPGAFAFIPEVALSKNLYGVRLAGNLSYRLRQPTRYLGAIDINPEIGYRLGVGYDISAIAPKMNSLLVFGELFGATADRNPFGLIRDPNASAGEKRIEDVEARLTNPLEWAVGARYLIGWGVKVEGGFGSGILPGYGSPDLRVFAGVRYGVENRDKDQDGIEDSVDQCPDDPEDKDGFEDQNGCPDPDNDGDGNPDATDKCPNEAEDADGFEDQDGCPELDNDKDGIKDADDKCPIEPGSPKYQGCPAPDRDKDTVADDEDKCPDVPGKPELQGCPDKDGDNIADPDDKCPEQPGPADTGGCPDQDGDKITDADDACPTVAGTIEFKGCPDKDKDGIPEPPDRCPDEPETINGVDDEDGCPDKGKVLVVVTKEKIELKETVFFDTGKDTIKKVSFALLNQVALVMKAHPEIKKVRVEGHTDDQGPDDFNLDLSKRRAASVVRYLVDHGVDASRLESEGYGETQPIDSNKSMAGRAKNRRVDLKIVEQE